MINEPAEDIAARLARLEVQIGEIHSLIVNQKLIKDFYSTAEVALALGKAEYTVREWCRQGRVHAEKRAYGRGRAKEWIVSHQELVRLKNEGLLPDRRLPSGFN
ncbi:MAG: helix-turn-helix domain-containing protein [Isosphaeraceae bacterium]